MKAYDKSLPEDEETISEKIYHLVHVLLLDDPEDEEAKMEEEDRQRAAQREAERLAELNKPDLDERGEPIEEL